MKAYLDDDDEITYRLKYIENLMLGIRAERSERLVAYDLYEDGAPVVIRERVAA